MLFLSFWDIGLDNLGEGTLRHRCVTPAKAKQLIVQARKRKELMCVSDSDLLAPYSKDECKRQEEFCSVLSKHFGIAITFDDFLRSFDHEGERHQTINPLVFAHVQGADRILVVTCAYSWERAKKAVKKSSDFFDRMKIAPDSVKFHLIESVGGRPSKSKKASRPAG